MRYLLWGDLHAYPHTIYSRPTEGGLTTHIDDLFKTGDWLEEVMLEEKPDAMVFLGDYFHAFGQIDMQSLQVLKVWERLNFIARDLDIPAMALVGNHDYYDTYANIHSLPTASHVVDTPRVVEFGDDRVLLLPYSDDLVSLRFAMTDNEEHNLIFAHVPVQGAHFATGAVEQTGVDPADFQNVDAVFNGHYHMPGALDVGDILIHTVGAVIASSFNDIERDIPHGALIFDSVTGDAERLENPHSALFNKFEVYTDDDLSAMDNAIQEDKERRVLRVKASAEYKDEIERCYRPHVKYLQLNVLAPELGMEEARTEISIDETPIKNLDRYIELSECPDAVYGQEILKEVVAEHPFDAAGEFLLSFAAIENFLSIGSAEYEAVEGLLVLVEGKNGSGKTSLQEAIIWAVYGTSPRGTGDAVLREGSKSCRVEVEVEIGGKLYMIARGRKDKEYKSQPHLFTHNEKADKFVPVDARVGGNTQAKIDALVGVPEEMMRQIVFLTQSLENRFTDLGDADRKRLLGKLSGVEIYMHAERRVREELKTLEQEETHAHGQVTAAERSCDRQAQQIEKHKQELGEFNVNTKGRLTELKAKRRTLEKEIPALEKDAIELARQVAEFNSLFVTQDENLELVEAEVRDAQNRRNDVSTERAVCSSEHRRLKDMLKEPVCPTCGQSIDSEAYQEQYDEAEGELDRFDSQIDDIDRELVEFRNHVNELKEERRVSMAEQRNAQAEQSALDRQTLPAHRKALQRIEADLTQFETAKKDIETQLRFAEDEYKAAEDAIKSATDEAAQIQDKAAVVAWWVKAFGKEGIVSWLYDEVLVFLNDRLRTYSDILFGDIVVSLSSTRQLKSGDAKNEIDIVISGGRPYKKLSSGERRRIDLALQFALNDLAVTSSGFRTNLLICDEVDDYLDWYGKTGLVDILLSKAAAKMFILLMTHNAELKSLIPNRWSMVKEDGESILRK